MPLVVILGDDVFCVHGGLSPSIESLDDIKEIDWFREPPQEGSMIDLIWSDPHSDESNPIDGWAINSWGSGFMFGEKACDEFLLKNGL